MKKRIIVIISSVVLLFSFCTMAYATEVDDTVDTAYAAVEETVDTTATDIDEYHTIFTRLWEYCNEYKTELLGVLGDIAIFVLALFIKLRNDKRTTNIAQGIVSIKGDTSDTQKSQTSIVGVVNEMVDGYNALKQSYDKYGETEDDRNRVVGALVAQNTAILEILTTVYANSKNLPQGVKDLVNLKYANCLKSLDDDEQLKAIITAVRENIGTSMTVEPTEEKGTKTEV